VHRERYFFTKRLSPIIGDLDEKDLPCGNGRIELRLGIDTDITSHLMFSRFGPSEDGTYFSRQVCGRGPRDHVEIGYPPDLMSTLSNRCARFPFLEILSIGGVDPESDRHSAVSSQEKRPGKGTPGPSRPLLEAAGKFVCARRSQSRAIDAAYGSARSKSREIGLTRRDARGCGGGTSKIAYPRGLIVNRGDECGGRPAP